MNKMINFIKTILFCIKASWCSSRLYTTVRFISRTLIPIIPIYISFSIKTIIDILSTANINTVNNIPIAITYISYIFVCTIFTILLNKLTQYCESLHNDKLSQYLKINIIDIAIMSDIEMYDNKEFYDKFTMLKQDVNAIVFILWNIVDCIGAVIALIVAVVALAGQNALFCVILVISTLPSVIITNRYTKLTYNLGINQVEEERKKGYIDSITTAKQYAQEIRLFNFGSILKNKYTIIWNGVIESKKKLLRSKAILTILIDILPEILIFIMLCTVIQHIFTSNMTVGDFSLYISLFNQIASLISLLILRGSTVLENKLKIDNIKNFNKLNLTKIINGNLPLTNIDKIEFKRVWFKYPQSMRYAIKDISFIIEAGSRTGIVGVNGAGKSTIIKLLTRLYDTTKGEILINGIDIKCYKKEDLRDKFSCYFQNTLNYAFTLRENIQMSSISNDDANVYNALEKVGLKNIDQVFPRGLDTYITCMFDQKGAELSEGQLQKIGLARAFYKKCDILILDEPSSNLDPEAEYNLFQNINDDISGKTVIFTSHRLSNINLAEKILVIEKGVLVESGTKVELLSTSSRFAELYRYQSSKYMEDKNDSNN